MCQHHQEVVPSSLPQHPISMLFQSSHMMMGGMENQGNHSSMLMYFTRESFDPWVKYVLFENWNATNDWKYALSVLGIFFIAFFNQFIFFFLHIQVTKKRKWLYYFLSLFAKPLGFFLEMSIGYLLMLVSMTYNFGLFCAIIGGNFIGYIIFQQICTHMLEGYYNQDQIDPTKDEKPEPAVEEEAPLTAGSCCHAREKSYERISETNVKRYDSGVVNNNSMNIQNNNTVFESYIEGSSPAARYGGDW